MDISDVQLVGGPCGQHGPYTFYKAFKYAKGGTKKLITLSEFFFVKMWRDSDLLCIGELQLLWTDKNSEQTLASLRLYFLPENTPEGRMDQGEDEVLAISEKVVIRLEDLITWITVETEWNWGRLAKCEEDLKGILVEPEQLAAPRKPAGNSFSLSEVTMDFSDVEQDREKYENPLSSSHHVIILSFPKYCRYRAMMRRLEGVEDLYLKYKIVNALGGFYVKHPNTRVLFCRDTFDYPELEGHELLCNHLAPKLKGRPRGRRKKRSISPGSESNESESSVSNHFARITERFNGVCSPNSTVATRRSTRCHENNENKQFMKVLSDFMKAKQLPMGRVPSLGYKELNLFEFYTRVQKLGGYECVTTNRLWKSIFDDMTGHLNSTSAATIIRRHYERFLLAYERNEKGEEDKPIPSLERRRLKNNKETGLPEFASSDSESGTDTPSTSRSSTSPPVPESIAIKESPSPGKTSSLRSIRVKPERQKEKSNGENQKTSEPEQIISSLVVKNEPEDFKPALITEKDEEAAKDEKTQLDIKVEVTVETNVTVAVKVEERNEEIVVKEKVKEEEPDGVKPSIPEGTKTEGSILPEPMTNAVAPVVTTVVPEKNLSPIEAKENIPTSKMGPSGETPKESASVTSPLARTETNSINKDDDSSLREVKRIKLDILKEGGLEVTPVRSISAATAIKEFRPSVIQSATSSFPAKSPMGPPPLLSNVLPKRSPPSLPASINITQIKAPSTPVKQPAAKTPENFQFLNGATPPKVVQSRSIYSYSEKVVYGNPKDIFQPNSMPHAPRSTTSNTIRQQPGSDPMDLSLTSPQKPVIEIMPVPQNYSMTAQMPYNRASVTKNLYKSPAPLPDGRKLGPNLEITLVNPIRQPQTSSSSGTRSTHKRSGSETYAQKIAKLKSDELRHSKYNSGIHSMYKSAMDVPVPNHHYMKSSSVSSSSYHKPDIAKQNKPTPPMLPPQMLQNYVPRFVPPETPNPFLPLIDPLYYQAALQNVYSNMSHPMLPIPTPEQLKFYADFMAQGGRYGMPFGHPGDGPPSMNNSKKP